MEAAWRPPETCSPAPALMKLYLRCWEFAGPDSVVGSVSRQLPGAVFNALSRYSAYGNFACLALYKTFEYYKQAN